MTNISTREVLEPLIVLFDDLLEVKPELRSSIEDAIFRIVKLANTRGHNVLFIDFVTAGNHFDNSLSRGRINNSFPHSLGNPKKQKFVFQGLLNECFSVDGTIKQEVCHDSVRFMRNILYFYKKVKFEAEPERVLSSVEKFFRIERGLRPPTLSWDLDEIPSRRLTFLGSKPKQSMSLFHDNAPCDRFLAIFDMVCDRIASSFPIVPYKDLMPKHGPGSVCDMRSSEDKYSLKNWPAKLDYTFPMIRYAYSSERAYHMSSEPWKSLNEPPAKLIAVPKTMKGPRLITSELTSHQFLQQGLLSWMRDNLPHPIRRCYAVRSQEPSKAAALSASIDGSFATVDLSSASDLLSLWTVERAFSANYSLLKSFHATRSRWCSYTPERKKGHLPTSNEESITRLRKFSGQGSGVTFPVQSIIYACCCFATIIFEESMSISRRGITRSIDRASRKCRVYGDDIILPSSMVLSLYQLLNYLQLKVNCDKSHYQGRFRESCGTDAFEGHDVTPLYLRSFSIGNPNDLQSWVDVRNNAFEKGLTSVVGWMDDRIPKKLRKRLPLSTTRSHSGICLLSYHSSNLDEHTRFNEELHRIEVDALCTTSSSKRRRRKVSEENGLLQYFIESGDHTVNCMNHNPIYIGLSPKRSSFIERGWVPSNL